MIRILSPLPDPTSLGDALLAAFDGWAGSPFGSPVALIEALIDRWEART